MEINKALGISIGDKLTTSYGSGPYEVKSIWGAYWWWTSLEANHDHVTIWQYPVASFTVSQNDKRDCYINHVHQDGNRWFSDSGDEIFVEKNFSAKKFHQIALFDFIDSIPDDPRRQPYRFDPDVDYSNQETVFQCWKCRRDFNGKKWNGGHANPHCPYCNAWVAKTVIVMDRVIPGNRYWNEYQRLMGFSFCPGK